MECQQPDHYSLILRVLQNSVEHGIVHQKWSAPSVLAAAFVDTATSSIYSFLLIHYLIYSFVSVIYLFIYLWFTNNISIAQNFTTPNGTVSVQSMSISVQNFHPTQLFLYCNTATCFGTRNISSSGCQIKTTLKKVRTCTKHTHTKYSLVSFL